MEGECGSKGVNIAFIAGHHCEGDRKGQYISLKGFLVLYGRGKSHQCELANLPCLTRKLS